MASKTNDVYVLTGIKTGVIGEQVPLRLELDSWYPGKTQEHLIQNSLFLWALKLFEEKDPTEKLSFFQVAGIHGYPYQPWDEEEYTAAAAGAGYCTHNSILFPSWHRPYMLLYEQALSEIMTREIIPKIPDAAAQQTWENAAATWRLPFWDWALKKDRPEYSTDPGTTKLIYDVPVIAKYPTIDVLDYQKGNAALTVEIDNPMYKFTIPGTAPMGSYGINDIQAKDNNGRFRTTPFSKAKSSSRWADFVPQQGEINSKWVDGTVNNTLIAEALQTAPWYNPDAAGVPLAEMVYRLYEPDYIQSFAQFATTKLAGEKKDGPHARPESYLNLEFIHNNIHNWTGGFGEHTGHMAEVAVAGFDPIFFMHHCNVDRQFALWQALNPGNGKNWFDNHVPPFYDDGTWAIEQDKVVTPQTTLAPFHKDAAGTCFTSDDIRDWTKLGYSYPELQPWKYKDEDGKIDHAKYTADIRSQLSVLYQPQGSPTLHESVKWDIIVNITYDRFAFGGIPYTIYLFVGDKTRYDNYRDPITGQPVPPHKNPQHVGFVYTFSNPVFGARAGGRGCGKCETQAEQGTLCRAQIPLTGALLARAQIDPHLAPELGNGPAGILPLPSLEKGTVDNYLGDFLHWNVTTSGGTGVEVPDENAFIEVAAYHRAARFDDRASAERYTLLEGATSGKPGGFAPSSST
ncbi:common central domain of tyrosinase-domain-containing protein [Chaetomium tenue]|uniref:Common central domain of tyrosinase-domain-containing protein n=1 Tax=Chaetomium tenue TaxID=1854479 RepID=A0ACB7P0J0_9PEZI|nr:common central domain of tyrosinase-domain-containing protein [Chaetomium globosum]